MYHKKLLLLLPLLAGLLAGLLLHIYLVYSQQGALPGAPANGWHLVQSAILGAVAGAMLYGAFRVLNTLLPWHQYFALRFFAAFVLYVLLILGVVWGGFELYKLLARSPGAVLPTDVLLKLVIVVVLATFVYVIAEFALFSYHRYARLQIESVMLEQAKMALQYELLRDQLSPHYLFNGLNTLSWLIHENAELAETYIRKLAQTYQYLLRTQPQQLVPLSEELAFLQSYFFLLQVRFGENLKLAVELPDELLRTFVPPLTLQLLLENAVKHNIISKELPLQIRISRNSEGEIAVQNTLAPKQDQEESYRVGLQNICKRYRYFTSRPVKVAQDLFFEVTLPVLHAAQPAGKQARVPDFALEAEVSRPFHPEFVSVK